MPSKDLVSKVTIACSCCGEKTSRFLYKGLTSVYSIQQWSLVECVECGNIITFPSPNESLLSNIYSTSYLYSVHLLIYGEKKMRAKSLSGYIKKKCNPDSYKSILEIGCLYGYLLQTLMDQYKVKGIELDQDAVKYCRDNGLNVIESSVEEFLVDQNEKFDVIILSHVFEHLLNPEDVLKKLKTILNKNGKIVISVPNSNSICRKIFGRYWGWWQVPVHINHFKDKALRSIAMRNNFNVTDIKYRGGDSLMLLLNFINLFGYRGKNAPPGRFSRLIIKLFTFLFRYWYYLGNEEITVIMSEEI